MPVGFGGLPINITVQSFLNSATNLTITIPNDSTVATLKSSINGVEGTPTAIMNLYFNGTLLTDATVINAAGIVDGSYIASSSNLTESGLWTKQQRQEYKLQLAALKRAADGNSRRVYDISELPTKYSGNNVYDNLNEGGLVQGRPWATTETPNSIAGLRFWLDTATTSTLNSGTYTDGATLTAWAERKQNASYANPIAQYRPTIQSGAGDLLNGYPVVRFAYPSAGQWDQAEWTSVSGFANATGYTMILLAKLTSNVLASSLHLLRIRNTSGTYSTSIYYNTAAGRFDLVAPTGSATVDTSVDPDGTWKIITVRYDSTAAAANRFTFRWAKTARTVTNATTPSGALAADAGNNIMVGYFWDADWAEQMVYNTALSDAQIIALEDYLSSKWGV